jgi:hypothetical protein
MAWRTNRKGGFSALFLAAVLGQPVPPLAQSRGEGGFAAGSLTSKMPKRVLASSSRTGDRGAAVYILQSSRGVPIR